MPLTSGTKLGPFEIRDAIGAGGMGEIYRATDTRAGPHCLGLCIGLRIMIRSVT